MIDSFLLLLFSSCSLFSFIESFGTHIVTSATIGGRDVVYIRQHQSSPLSTSDIENYVKDIGDHRFVDSKSQSTPGPLKYKDKVCVLSISQHIFPSYFIIFLVWFYQGTSIIQLKLSTHSWNKFWVVIVHCLLHLCVKILKLCFSFQDVTVIFRRRGGDDLEQSHVKWAETVQLAPDVINMTFTPIVSLLEGVPGIKHLSRAIELYLECKTQSKTHCSENVALNAIWY